MKKNTKKSKKSTTAKKAEQTNVRVFSYGCDMRRVGEDAKRTIRQQLWLGHDYRNKRVRIEQDRRAAYRELRASLDPSCAELEAAYQAINDKIGDCHGELRKLPHPSIPGQSLPKRMRHESPAAEPILQRIEELKKERKKLGEQLGVKYDEIAEKHFASHDLILRRERLCAIIRHAAKTYPFSPEELALLDGPDGSGQNYDEALATAASRKDPATDKVTIDPHTMRRIKKDLWTARLNDPATPAAYRRKIQIDAEADEKEKQARDESGCAPGVYQAVNAACKTSFKEVHGDPRFVKWDRTGKVGKQIPQSTVKGKKTKGIPVKLALSGASAILHIEERPDILCTKYRSDRYRRVAILHASVGDKGKMRLDIPFVMHRPLPENGVITWFYIQVTRIGGREVYHVQFTVRDDSLDRSREQPGRRLSRLPLVAINFGWRALEQSDMVVDSPYGGTRHAETGDVLVATCYDGKDEKRFVIPQQYRHQTVSGFEILLSHAKKHFNVALSEARDYLKASEGKIVCLRDAGFNGGVKHFSEHAEKHLPDEHPYKRGSAPWRDAVEKERLRTKQKRGAPIALDAKTKRRLSPDIRTSIAETLSTMHAWRAHGKLATFASAMAHLYLKDVRVSRLWRDWVRERKFNTEITADERRRKVEDRRDLFASRATISKWLAKNGVHDPNEQMALYLEWWRRKDEHLTNDARSVEKKIRRRILETYRIAADRLARDYDQCVVPDFNLKKVAKAPAPEDNTRSRHDEFANDLRHFCGTYRFTETIGLRFGKARFVKRKLNKPITTNHFGCGGKATSDPKLERMLLCKKCGAQFDQDLNAAMHLWHDEQPAESKEAAE